MAKLVKAGVTLRNEVNKRWPRRDKRSDGWIGDKAHQARKSDHNPDAHGWVHAIDIDADLDKLDPQAAQKLANQIVTYAASNAPGADRIKYVVFNDQIASGTYPATRWVWRGRGYGHFGHIHVSFTDKAERDGRPFPLPILRRP